MNAPSTPSWVDVRACVDQRDRSFETWSIHVDEIAQWRPQHDSFDSWFRQLCDIYRDACLAIAGSGAVAVALSLEASAELETFTKPTGLVVDFFTPPSLYVLRTELLFPSAGEEYYRVLKPDEVGGVEPKGVVIGRSARSLQGLENGWEFDNTIYVASHFGGYQCARTV